MLPSAVNDTMRDMMAQIRDVGDGIRGGTYTMTAPVITGGSINGTTIGATTASTGAFSTLSATGVTTVQAGTVSAPAITTTGDTNTGMFFPAADTIAFSEGGTEAMRINADAQIVATAGTASLPVITTTGDTNTGIFFPAADTIAFTEGGAEAMRITSAGSLKVGTTANIFSTERASIDAGTSGYGLCVSTSTTGGFSALVLRNNDGAATSNQAFFIHGASTIVGSITTTASTTSYNITSDYRLKENVAPMTGALAKVSQLKPCTYKWKINGSNGQGFIAHELAEVVPDCVTGEKDAVDADGNIRPQGIDTSFLVATLTAAIQELKATVDAQAVRIATLESTGQ
jgi:hypothetical protein